jgi:Gpi18-like mannosyltransferase
VSARTAAVTAGPPARSVLAPLAAILGIGLLVRLVLAPSTGFHNDVSAFEAWTLTLHQNPPWDFYAKTTFADYPPGYFLVLWVLGGIYGLLANLHVLSVSDPAYFGLRLLVKVPSIAMDLVDAVLIFAIVRRYASELVALGATALFALNPTTIYVSAYWGQIDSVAWGLVLLALWLVLRSNDIPSRTVAVLVWAWIAMGFSILIKPQGALVAIVLIAYAFATTDPVLRARRLRATGIGIAAALVLALAVTELFHPTANPFAALIWLFERYLYGSAVYPYNSINAFNLYAIKQPFWQNDLVPLTFFGAAFGSMVVWGIALVLAATALVTARYIQQRDDRAFLEAAMLVAFAFFCLATRMHERYIYGAFLLSIPLVAFGRRYWWVAIGLSITTLLNLVYSFAYQTVMEQHTPGVDATNLWPIGSHVVAAFNVGLFFVLGYLYLGGTISAIDRAERGSAVPRARRWFDPCEGIARMTRLDVLLAAAFTLASFLVCIAWYQWPGEKIFDEIYYARAGEEYLKHIEIFEFTHPPLTKLIVTASMMLFGGLHGLGDTGFGWRFLNIVIGALTVTVIYLFGKRLTGSTLFAACAAAMLTFDGFHFVQSRIATPEITVAFFSLTTLYAFYRLWTAVGSHRVVAFDWSRRAWIQVAAILAVGAGVAAWAANVAVTLGPSTKGQDLKGVAWLVAFLYVETLFYLFARWSISGGRRWLPASLGGTRGALPAVVSYADGSRLAYDAGGAATLLLPEGDRLPRTGTKRDELDIVEGEAHRRYLRDGRLVYATPTGDATFAPSGDVEADGVSSRGSSAWVWLGLLALSGGALAASKWNGLFDFFVVWICIALVVGQRFLRRPAMYGNPFGMPLDVVIGLMFVIGGAIYTLCYIPFFTLGHNYVDMVTLQREMYSYHANLKATHPYASQWWQWPILERPISYFYSEYAPYKVTHVPNACCVAEILALPNPFVWWAGLITVPIVGWLAWIERNRGYALLVIAYFIQWLPWIGSPRIAFEYHFYPNLAIIVLANAVILQRIWAWRSTGDALPWPKIAVGAYMAIVLGGFIFFYPVLAGVHVPWDAWHARMWINRWII